MKINCDGTSGGGKAGLVTWTRTVVVKVVRNGGILDYFDGIKSTGFATGVNVVRRRKKRFRNDAEVF